MPEHPLVTAIKSWRSLAMTQGADTDHAPEPERRDPEGDVPPTFAETDPPPFAEQAPEPPAAPPAVAPVEIVAPVAIIAASSWQISTITVGTTPIRIANADPDRLTISVTDRGAATLYVASSRENVGAGPTRGQIQLNETRTWSHTAEIWAVTLSATAVVEITTERS